MNSAVRIVACTLACWPTLAPRSSLGDDRFARMDASIRREGWDQDGKDDVRARAALAPPDPLDKVVRVEFPKGGYHFTLAEAARRVTIEYTIVVDRDCEGVSPRPWGPSFWEPPGPSGLHPRERISGGDQNYCLEDFGLGHPPREEDQVFKVLKMGTYRHSFAWDGRNWNGPSDTSNPKGKPFPAGTYDVTVRLHGLRKAGKGTVPYELTGKAKLVLQ